MTKDLSFVVVSDTHIGPTEDFELQGVRTAEKARRVVAAIGELVEKPAFIVHLGDVAADPLKPAYSLVEKIFAPLRAQQLPIWLVAGNHDGPEEIAGFIDSHAAPCFAQGPSCAAYSFSVNDHRFVTLDARESDQPWNGELGDAQLDFLITEISKQPRSLSVFLHYPPRPLAVPWIDRRMLLLNGARLHAILRSLPAGVLRGVFSGHIHRAAAVIEDGILYQSAPAVSVSMNVQPGVTEPSFSPEPAPLFSLVRFTGSRTIVSHHQA